MKRVLLILLPVFFVCGCSLKYTLFKEESKYFSRDERRAFEQTADALGYGYGYDVDIDLDYVFKKDNRGGTISRDEKKIRGILSGSELPLIQFYEKIYVLREMMEFKMGRYAFYRRWREYTYIKKYLLPVMDDYHNYIQDAVFKIKPDYAKSFDSRMKMLNYEAHEMVLEKEDADEQDGP